METKYSSKSVTLVFNDFNLDLTKMKGGTSMPTETSEVYECEICGAVVEVKEGGAGDLECCGQPMTLK